MIESKICESRNKGEKKNLIVFIDGAYGVGKTTVLHEIDKSWNEKINILSLEADEYFNKWIREKVQIVKEKGGILEIEDTFPQNDVAFIEWYKEIICEKQKEGLVISDMSLTTKLCKEKLLDYFDIKQIKFLHIILEANKSILKNRIINDINRDKSFALREVKDSIEFLESNYYSAIRISTEDRKIEDYAQEIIEIIKKKLYIVGK